MQKHQVAALEGFVLMEGQKYFYEQGFTPLYPPRIVRASGACENVNTLFEVSVDKDFQWFGSQAYLAQTGQLYLEAFVPFLNKVFCVGPSFRAESAIDKRHLTEFTMLEIEFAGDFEDLLKHIQGLLYHLAQAVANFPEAEAKFGLSQDNLNRLKSCPANFSRFTYDEAIKKLQALGEQIKWGDDISSAREKMLVESVGNQPLFLTHYPDPMYDFGEEIEVEKFFNMLPDAKTPGRVLSSDTILPFSGESVGAAARVHILEEMVKRLENSKMYKRLLERGGSLADFQWYIDQMKANGAVPHAGCGFGISRILQWIHGIDNITEAVTFPANKGGII